MEKSHILTNQPDLVTPAVIQRAMFEAGYDVPDPDVMPAFPKAEAMKFASAMSKHGADLELDSCEKWVDDQFGEDWGAELRYYRRLGAREQDALRYLEEIKEALESSDAYIHRSKIQLIRGIIMSSLDKSNSEGD
jgi:hypothetical protein